jgi:2-methylisocitrate lyase-like PEP mutase family enzyme
VRQLAAVGVARISTGSLLFRAALGAIEVAARDIRDATYVPDATVPGYQRVASMP